MSASSICGHSQLHAYSCHVVECLRNVFGFLWPVTIACACCRHVVACLQNVVTYSTDMRLHIVIVMSAVFSSSIFTPKACQIVCQSLARRSSIYLGLIQHIPQSWQLHDPSWLILATIYPPPYIPLQCTMGKLKSGVKSSQLWQIISVLILIPKFQNFAHSLHWWQVLFSAGHSF